MRHDGGFWLCQLELRSEDQDWRELVEITDYKTSFA